MIKRAAPTDSEILECYQRDRVEGFPLLYHKYSDRILAVCRRYSAGMDETMDYFQEAMMRIDGKIDRFKYSGEGSLLQWMSRVTVNLIVDHIRKSRKIRIVDIDQVGIIITDPTYEESFHIPVEEMWKMVGKLSPMKRIVFNMSIVEGYNYKEIAGLLEITEDGASSTMSKARKELARMVNEYLKNSGQ